jgi:AcrR family transcriptional regulator
MTRGNIRPGGRTERVRQSVAATVLHLIKSGATEFSMLDVAEQSGIARSTIYARWPTREALIAEALTTHNSTFQVKPWPDWRDHLRAIAAAFRDFSSDPDEIAINGLIASLGPGFLNEETRRQWLSISHDMGEPLRAAQRAGSIRPDVDVTVVIATLFTSIAGMIVMAKDRPDDAHLEQLTNLLIRGCEIPEAKG